jgi:ABC-2 type transport system ATP-binding protein
MIGSGRIVASGAKSDLLRSHGSMIRSLDRPALSKALFDAGISCSPVGEDALMAQADVAQVGQVAFAAGVSVVELRAADDGGLEARFLELTSDTRRGAAADIRRGATADTHPSRGAVA